MKKLVLASASPRRHKLLEMIGLDHEVIPSRIDEVADPALPPHLFAEEIARLKGLDIARRHPGRLVISADTIVILDGKILGKPAGPDDAIHMLRTLSERTHEVITAVGCFISTEQTPGPAENNGEPAGIREHVFHVRTEVRFGAMSDREIRAYVNTGSPLDKAGAYGIQDDLGSLFVAEIIGDYYNVVGLPVHRLYHTLKTFAPGYLPASLREPDQIGV